MLEYMLFILGFVFLVKGADFLVEGSSSLAKKLGVSSLVVGLTVVAFGTSMPEFVVSVLSSFSGFTDVAIGNVVGSNIANILFILGLTTLIYPLKAQLSTIWREIPFSLMAAIILFTVSNDLIIDKMGFSSITRIDGILMFFFFILFLYYVYTMARERGSRIEKEKLDIKKHKNHEIVFLILAGMGGLFLGGKWVVEGAVFVARNFGLSEFLISATMIAIGTSLPELVTSLVAAMKKEADIAIGGIVGSNIFNIFWILGVTSIISPIVLPAFVNFDMMFLMSSTILLFSFMFVGTRHSIDRWQGALLLALYAAYLILIIVRG